MVYITVTGNGVAYVDDYDPVNGQAITLICRPGEDYTLDNIIAEDANGHSIAVSVTQQQTIIYQSSWGALFINAIFSGSPTPPTPQFPKWILFKIRDGNNNVR